MIEKKIEQSENKMTEKIRGKILNTLDKRITSETSKIIKEIDDKLSDLRKEFGNKIDELSKKLDKGS